MARPLKTIPVLSDADKRRFLSKVSTTPPENTASRGCRLWTACKNTQKQPVFSIGKTPYLARRVAYTLAYGADPGTGQVVSSCSNSLCVHPDHLWLKTELAAAASDWRQWNNGDAVRLNPLGKKANRAATPRGQLSRMIGPPRVIFDVMARDRAKLTASDYRGIRASNRPPWELSSTYDVSLATITLIQNGKMDWVAPTLHPAAP